MKRSEFENIATQLRQTVLKTALDFFGNREDAEDAAQEAMVQLWRHCEHIDAGRNLEALAVKVAKNCCVNIYRKKQRNAIVADIDMQPISQMEGEDSPQELLEAKDMERMLSEAIDQLKPRERQLFKMRVVQGLSSDEIALQTGIPKPSVIAMVSAARKKVLIALRIISSVAAIYLVGLFLWLQMEPEENAESTYNNPEATYNNKVEKTLHTPQPEYCMEGTLREILTCYLQWRHSQPDTYKKLKQMSDESK